MYLALYISENPWLDFCTSKSQGPVQLPILKYSSQINAFPLKSIDKQMYAKVNVIYTKNTLDRYHTQNPSPLRTCGTALCNPIFDLEMPPISFLNTMFSSESISFLAVSRGRPESRFQAIFFTGEELFISIRNANSSLPLVILVYSLEIVLSRQLS